MFYVLRVQRCVRKRPQGAERILKTLAVHDACAVLPPLLLRYPHVLEARQTCQNAGTAEHAVAAIFGGTDLDFHGGWGEAADVLFKALLKAWVHGGASADDDVVVKVLGGE